MKWPWIKWNEEEEEKEEAEEEEEEEMCLTPLSTSFYKGFLAYKYFTEKNNNKVEFYRVNKCFSILLICISYYF